MPRLTRTDWIPLGVAAVCGLGVALGLFAFGGFNRDSQSWTEPLPELHAAEPPSVDEFRPRVVIKRRFRPITKFPIATAKSAEGKINDAE
ncbi:MAG: hypothetical protein IIA67_05105, partial [Planctomycetes bacterium]|nr:hypothetical protein [Planctomycetota bacterium]